MRHEQLRVCVCPAPNCICICICCFCCICICICDSAAAVSVCEQSIISVPMENTKSEKKCEWSRELCCFFSSICANKVLRILFSLHLCELLKLALISDAFIGPRTAILLPGSKSTLPERTLHNSERGLSLSPSLSVSLSFSL